MNIQNQLFSGISFISQQGRKVISTAIQNKVTFVGLVALSFTIIYKLGMAYKNQSQKPSGPAGSSKPPTTPSPSPIQVNLQNITKEASNTTAKEDEKAQIESAKPKTTEEETKKKEEEALKQKKQRQNIIEINTFEYLNSTITQVFEKANQQIETIKMMLQKNFENPITLSEKLSIADYIKAFNQETSKRIKAIQESFIDGNLYFTEDLNLALDAFEQEEISPPIDPDGLLNLIENTNTRFYLYENLINSLIDQLENQAKLLADIKLKLKENNYPCKVPDFCSKDPSSFLEIENKKDLEELIKCYDAYIVKLDKLIDHNSKNKKVDDCLNAQLNQIAILKYNLTNIKKSPE